MRDGEFEFTTGGGEFTELLGGCRRVGVVNSNSPRVRFTGYLANSTEPAVSNNGPHST